MKAFSEKDPLRSENNMARHSVPKIVLIIATIVVFALTAAFNGLAAAGNGGGVFNNRTGDISDAFYLEVTPAGWTFTIWGFIYAWQAAWLIYALVTICRRKVGTYVYLMPVFPSVLFFAYIFNNVSNVAWLFAWDQMKLAIALPLIALTPLTLFVCLYFSFKTLYDNLDYLIRNGAIADIWLIRLLIQNGIAFYAAWVTVATFINVALVMTYKNGDLVNTAVPQDVSSTVFLSVVLVVIVVWFSLDMSFLDKYTRYTFAPYITWTVALAGIISKNYDLDTAYRNSIISVVVQAVAATCLVVKIPVMIWRHFKRPIQPLLSDFKPTV